MDVFVEHIIRRKYSALDYLISVGVVVAGFVVITAVFLFLTQFAPLALVGVCFGAYYLLTSRNLEFEYAVTNGDMTIDKIINRRRRKRMVVMDVHDAEAFGEYRPKDHEQKPYDKRIIVSEYADGRNSWFVSGRSAKYGKVLVVFTPEERVLKALKPFLPRQLQINAFGRN